MRAPLEKKFRLNPLEVLILLVVFSGFSFSVYNVFQEADRFRFAALEPMKADPTRSARTIASEATGVPLEVPCSQNPGFTLRGKECPRTPTDPGAAEATLHLIPRK